jgi:predicted  nucleic acid-binding Zn-ribbon protein
LETFTMAGRPASRGGGLTGIHYGLFAFVFVSVAALGAFIWQFNETNRAREEADRLKSQLDSIGTPAQVYKSEGNNRKTTAVRVMEDYLQSYGKLVSGDSEAVYPSVRFSASQAISKAVEAHPEALSPTTDLIEAVRRLTSTLSVAKTDLAQLKDNLSRLRTSNTELTQLSQTLGEEFKTDVEAIKADYQQTEDRYNSDRAELEDQREQLQASLDRTAQELQRLRVESEGGATGKDKEIERLTAVVEDLRSEMAEFQDYGLDPEAILTKADGKILRAVPGSDIVYINLGEEQKVKVGMGFEIFSQLGATQGVRGKASIEVVAVLPITSECRVTRQASAHPIIEGDIIVNLAYERDRRPKFVVRGEFDLDYDGRPDTASGGGDRVAAIIEQWGRPSSSRVR